MRIFILGASETLWTTARHLHLTGCGTVVAVVTRKSSLRHVRTEADFKAMADELGAPFMIREELDESALELVKNAAADVCIAVDWLGSLPIAAGLFPLGVVTPAFGDPASQSGNDIDLWAILHSRQELELSVRHTSPKDGLSRVLPVSATISLDANATIADIRRYSDSRTPSVVADALGWLANNSIESVAPALDENGIAKFHPIADSDRLIDWRDSAERIHAKIKAFTKPLPGAYTYMRDNLGNIVKLFVWRSRLVMPMRVDYGTPGLVIHCRADNGEAQVLAGNGIVALQSVSEGIDSPWFEPGKDWRADRTRLGLCLDDEVFNLLSSRSMLKE
jgi:Methionyl-tRNA formyltransferase